MSVEKSVGGARSGVQAVASSAARARLGTVLALMLLTATLLWPTTQSLFEAWEDTANLTYTHGYLIAAITIWLLVRQRAALQNAAVRPDYLAAAALAVASIVWLVAYRAGLQVIHQMLLPAIAWLAVRAASGPSVARDCAFALGFLYFAIPVWSQGNLVLQDITVVAVRTLLSACAVPAYVVDNVVHIPAGVFEIAGGCSGLHFFVVALAIAALYGELGRDTLKGRAALLALAAAIAMVGNWLRVFTIIVAGHLTDMQHFLVKIDHYYFGWVVFAVGIALFFVLARRLPLNPAPSAPARDEGTPGNGVPIVGFAVALIAMSVGPAWALVDVSRADAAAPDSVAAVALPIDPAPYSGPLSGPAGWQPHYRGADVERYGEYERAGKTISVYVATYFEQHQGKELVGHDNSIVGDSETLVAVSAPTTPTGLPVKELEVHDSRGRASLIWYGYRIGSRHFTSDMRAQLYYGAASLFAAPSSQLIALRTRCAPDCAAARTALSELSAAVGLQRESAGSAQK